MQRTVYKTLKTGVENADDSKMELTFTITTGAKDRDGDVVSPDGMVADNYLRNPVVAWAHSYQDLPMAKTTKLWKDQTNGDAVIKARAQFVPDSAYSLQYDGLRGSMIYNMYREGFLNATSIGFNPIEFEPLEKSTGLHFKQWELLEWSLVPVPSNAQALIDRGGDGLHQIQDLPPVYQKALRRWAKDALTYCESCEKTYLVDPDVVNAQVGVILKTIVDETLDGRTEKTYEIDPDELREQIDESLYDVLSQTRETPEIVKEFGATIKPVLADAVNKALDGTRRR